MTTADKIIALFNDKNLASSSIEKNPHKTVFGTEGTPLEEHIKELNEILEGDVGDTQLSKDQKEAVKRDTWYQIQVDHKLDGVLITGHYDLDKALDHMLELVAGSNLQMELEEDFEDDLFDKGVQEIANRIDEENRQKDKRNHS